MRSLYAPLRPVQIVLGRRGEEDEEPDRVRAVLFHDLRRVHDVAQGLGHLGAVLDHHALGQQVDEGFPNLHHPDVRQELREEPGVDQVQAVKRFFSTVRNVQKSDFCIPVNRSSVRRIILFCT